MYRDEQALRDLHAYMFQQSYSTSLAAAEKFDFSHFEYVVDIGGGTGGFLAGLCECVPGIEGAIFDLPIVEQLAVERMFEQGNRDRVQYIAGDFFKDPLPKNADLYVLGGILQDWGRDEGTRLLEKVYAALPDKGAVCIVESLFNDQRDGPYLTATVNLTMLVTNFGEQHTPAEFDDWLTGIGFDRVESRLLSTPRDIVVGWKA
jgi:hypothetical protein